MNNNIDFKGKIVAKPFSTDSPYITIFSFLLLTVCFHMMSIHKNRILFHFRRIFYVLTHHRNK